MLGLSVQLLHFFVYMSDVKAQVRLCLNAASYETPLLVYMISTKLLCAGQHVNLS